MKLLNITGRTIVSLGVIIILAVAVVWLVRGQALSPQTAQANTPTPVLTNTSLPTNTALPTATDTPAATSTPTPPPLVNFDTPAPGPTYTPTPPETPVQAMALVEPGQPVGGYSFGEARLIPGTVPHAIELFEWIPDDFNKLLLVRDGISLEVIDIQTGEIEIYYNSNTLIRDAVWLPAHQTVAFLVVDKQDSTKQHLFAEVDYQKQTTASLSPVFTTSVRSPLIAAQGGDDVILFDPTWQLIQLDLINNQSVKLAANTQDYVPAGYDHNDIYKAAQSTDRSKAAYYNKDWLLLADFAIGSITPIELNALRTEDMPSVDHIQVAAWSPSDEKLAFITVETSGGVYTGNNLFVLDLQSNILTFIENEFDYIHNITWGPDNTQLVILAETGLVGDGYATGALFLVNSISKAIHEISVLPDKAIIGSPGNLTWSPHGKSIAIVFGNEPRKPGLYIIDVSDQ